MPTQDELKLMAFARFWVNAVFNGAELATMARYYPDFEFQISDDSFILRKKPKAPEEPLPHLTTEGERTAEKIDLKVEKSAEEKGAAAAATAAVVASPLLAVE